MTVLVTGGAGYIGSHVTLALLDRGEDVVIIDDLSTGRRELLDPRARFVEGSIGDRALLERTFASFAPTAVMHFAARTVVPESVARPIEYWATNTVFAHTLLRAAIGAGVPHFVYSSTAAVYGEPSSNPVAESVPPQPINPYGASKHAFERMLFDAADADLIVPAALRYFNVAGADPTGRTGQSTPQATHLVKVAAQTALGTRPHLEIYGTDWDTADGTCVRDYIHVSDLADIHVRILDGLRADSTTGVFNCGYGTGYSVREVIDAALRVCGAFDVREGARRAGDPASLIADTRRLRAAIDWQPQHADLDHIVRTAFEWERRITH